MTATTDSRVQLNLRVSTDAKDDFEDRVHEKYGDVSPYAGVELEREFNLRLDDGAEGDLWDAVERVADVHGITPREKETQSFARSELDDPVTTVVSYYVSERVRDEVMQLAEASHSSAGEFVEAIMRTYADPEHGSVTERVIDRLERIEEVGEKHVDTSPDPVERRTETIADELRGEPMFDLETFDAAVSEARGIDASRYTRQKYLPRVLDELGYTWASSEATRFTDAETVELPEQRDVRDKPYILMSDDDRKLALKADALAQLRDGRRQFTVNDALDTLDGRPQRKTVRRLLREIAADEPGVEHGDGTDAPAGRNGDGDAVPRIKLDLTTLKRKPDAFARARGVVLTERSDTDTGDASDGDNWVDKVVSELMELPEDVRQRENVKTTKIAEAKHPDPYDDRDHVTEEARDSVSDSDRERVRERLAEETADDDPTPEATDTPRAAATDGRTDAVDEELNQITAAEHARGD